MDVMPRTMESGSAVVHCPVGETSGICCKRSNATCVSECANGCVCV